MSELERLPACATTGVGSLPFTDPAVAVLHAWHAYDMPFCPQLPALDGDMLTEWLGADPRRCGWSADRDRERPHAWDAFLAAADAGPHPPHGLVKLQVTGPLTLAHALDPDGGPGLAREIATWVSANTAGQVRTLAERGLSVLVITDEPALELVAPSPSDAEEAWAPLRTVGAAWGLHVCCAVPWPVIERSAPDVLSIDITTGASFETTALEALARQIRAGRRVAWGTIDAGEHPDPAQAANRGVRRLATAILALQQHGIAAETLLDASLLTPACGTANAPPDDERALESALGAIAMAGREWREAALHARCP